ncbi:MAG: hypothetical protein U5R48_00615 [Gammaproteobacteria bacterium]|nr:hypothetical protein [Gammaproteobacteria bacterium]
MTKSAGISGQAQRQLLGGGALAEQLCLHHAAVAVLVELAHAAAGIDRDLVRFHRPADPVPGNPGGSQGIGGTIDRHGQTTGMTARLIELFGIETGRQLSGGPDLRDPVVREEQIQTGRCLDPDVVVVQLVHGPAFRQRVGQHAATGMEHRSRAVGALHPQAAVARNRFGVEVSRLDPPDQRVGTDVLAHGGVRGLPVGQAHHRGEGTPGRRRIGLAERVDDQAPIGVMRRQSAGGVDAAQTDDHR